MAVFDSWFQHNNILLCHIQYTTHVLHLDPNLYFRFVAVSFSLSTFALSFSLSFVPVYFPWSTNYIRKQDALYNHMTMAYVTSKFGYGLYGGWWAETFHCEFPECEWDQYSNYFKGIGRVSREQSLWLDKFFVSDKAFNIKQGQLEYLFK